MQAVIQARNFVIEDQGIINEMDRLELETLHPQIGRDYDGELIITMHRNLYGISHKGDTVVQYKEHYYRIRTPSWLETFVGERVSYYQDKSIFRNFSEVFRIKPLTFKITSNKIKRCNFKEVPYFARSGNMVFPALYTLQNFTSNFAMQRMSFESNDEQSIASGFLYVHPIQALSVHKGLSFKISVHTYHASVKGASRVADMVESCGKNIFSFKYQSIDFCEDYPFGFLTFKEQI